MIGIFAASSTGSALAEKYSYGAMTATSPSETACRAQAAALFGSNPSSQMVRSIWCPLAPPEAFTCATPAFSAANASGSEMTVDANTPMAITFTVDLEVGPLLLDETHPARIRLHAH